MDTSDWDIEIETLQAVFLEQLKLKEDSRQLEIILLPNPDSKDESDNQVGLVFDVSLTKNYPEELPIMYVRPLKGVTSKQANQLMEQVQEQAKELLGMQMIYPLAQYLKDWLDEQNTNNLEKQKEASRAKDELEMEKEKEEYARKYKDGTVVTPENFKTWFKEFLAKHPEKVQWEADAPVVQTKLTGRQIFERGALLNVDLEGLAASADNKAKVDWELFQDEDLPEDEE